MLWPAISLSAPRLRNWVIGIAGLSAAAVLVGVMIVQPCQIAPEPVAAPDHYTQVVPTIEWVTLLTTDLQFSGTAMSAIAKQCHPEAESADLDPLDLLLGEPIQVVGKEVIAGYSAMSSKIQGQVRAEQVRHQIIMEVFRVSQIEYHQIFFTITTAHVFSEH